MSGVHVVAYFFGGYSISSNVANSQEMVSGEPLMTVAQHERIVAALSPAGGGVVRLPERHSRKEAFGCGGVAQEQFVKGWNACLDEVARLNAKPQANSQEGDE